MTIKRRLPSPRPQFDDSSSGQRLEDLRKRIAAVEPAETHEAVRRGEAVLVDVRERDEIAAGSAALALRLGRGFLELRIEQLVPERKRAIHVLCDGGARSLFAAESLERLGYENVATVAGGFERWRDQGLPVVVPRALGAVERQRFDGQVRMPAIGEAGQVALLESSALVVGTGGPGASAMLQLAAAGVGRLGIADDGDVELVDLLTGIAHTDGRLGVARTGSAGRALQAFHVGLEVVEHALPRVIDDARRVVRDYDVVVDCSGDAAVHEALARICFELELPHVWATTEELTGEVAVFWPACQKRRGPCWRCAHRATRVDGAIGAVASVIGSLQAVETIRLLVGFGDPPVGRVLRFDARWPRLQEIEVEVDPICVVCG